MATRNYISKNAVLTTQLLELYTTSPQAFYSVLQTMRNGSVFAGNRRQTWNDVDNPEHLEQLAAFAAVPGNRVNVIQRLRLIPNNQ